jgi:hypothetical protein
VTQVEKSLRGRKVGLKLKALICLELAKMIYYYASIHIDMLYSPRQFVSMVRLLVICLRSTHHHLRSGLIVKSNENYK